MVRDTLATGARVVLMTPAPLRDPVMNELTVSYSAVIRELAAQPGCIFADTHAAFADGLRTPKVVAGPPVLCLHGITQTGSNLWGIRRALEARGRPTLALSLGRLPRNRRHLGGRVAPAVEQLAALSASGRVDVVAHSLGGVVLRLVLADRPDLAAKIGRVVTLGSPHRGTASLRGLPLGAAIRRLGRRSTLLAGLPALPADHVTTVAAIPDLIVYPASTCHLPGSHCVDLPGVGHAGLLTRPEAIGAVLHALCDDPR